MTGVTTQMICIRLLVLCLALVFSACDRVPLPSETHVEAVQESALQHAVQHLDPKYVCPMHPQIIRDKPSNCPICGMDLVPVEQEQGSPDSTEGPVVSISPAVVNSLGVRTTAVERGRLWRRINTVGYVDYDESKVGHIHLRTEGWIERLHVNSEGDRVRKGAPLFQLYSPSLVTAQEEYLQALSVGNKALIRASRERLIALGFNARQVDFLATKRKVQQRVTIYAPQNGIVATLNVREGMFVKPVTEVLSLADLSSVWVLAEVFEQQADWVEEQQTAEVHLSFLPGRTWEGEVEYIYPSLDSKTRTLKVRLQFNNPDEVLKPNMYADVTIFGGAKKDVTYIPREGLIRTGKEQRVIIDLGDGRFGARRVTPGIESGDWVEIISGLREGEKIVVSGQFLIDSEASLKASLMRMSDTAGDTRSGKNRVRVTTVAGVLKQWIPDSGKANLQHEAIPSLGWPAMTMDFDLGAGVSMERVKPGDQVEFDLAEVEGGYVITAIRSMEARSETP